MGKKPAYEDLEKRVAELEKEVERLKSESVKYHTLFNSFPHGITISTSSGEIKETNLAAEQLLGVTKEEHEKRSIDGQEWRIIREDGSDMPAEEWASVIALNENRLVENCEMGIVKSDKSVIWLNVTASPLPLEGYGVVVTYRDITRRKKIEKALMESEARFASMFEHMSSGVAVYQPINDGEDFIFKAFNSAAEKITRIKREKVIGGRLLKHFPNMKGTAFFTALQNVWETGQDKHIKPFYYKDDIREGWRENRIYKLPSGEVVALFDDVTQNKEAEKRLQRREGQLRTLIESIPDLVWLKDPDGIYLSCNLKFERFFGEKEANIKGKTDYDFVDKEVADLFRENDQIALAADKPVVNEEEVIYADDGHIEVLETIKTPMYDTNNRLIGVLGIGRDITRRKQVEIDLIKNRDQLESILSNIQGITYRCKMDRYWTMMYMTNHVLELTGYPADDFINNRVRTYESIIHKDDTQNVYNSVVSALEKGKPWEIEYRINHRTGSIYWVYEKGAGNYGPDGNVKYLDGFIINITEQKQVQQKLWESNDRFQKIFDNYIDAIFVLDAIKPPRIIDCNNAVKAIFQYEKNELVGSTTDKLHVDQSYMKKFRNALYSAVEQTGTLHDFKFKMKRKDGTVFPSEHTVLELKTDLGERGGWIIIIRDLTEKEKNEALLQRVQRMEAIGNLAGGIAHDFNNILFPIIGMSELLLDDLQPGSPEHDNTNEILRAGMRGSELVKQILSFSRQQDHKIMPTRIQQILKEVLKLTRATIPSDIEIKQNIQQDCGIVNADATQIHQVAMNLITNAYHAVAECDGDISVELSEIDCTLLDVKGTSLSPRKYAVLTVSDTGTGISEDHMDKIFEPYFTTKEQGKGTGLGLSVVYGIIKAHQGDIKVTSEVTKGATFKVFLPLMSKSEPVKTEQKTSDVASGTERILLVDDEEAIVRIQKQIIERLGYEVSEWTSSIDALKSFKENPSSFDLVISDMAMPNLRGDRFAEELLKITPDIPIIICTGFSDKLNEAKAGQIGIKGILMKPVIKSDLAQMVRRVLDESKNL